MTRLLRLNKQNVPAGATLRVVSTPLEKGTRRAGDTRPSPRGIFLSWIAIQRHRERIKYLLVAIASDVSRAGQFYYIMHAVCSAGQILLPFVSTFLPGILRPLRRYSDGGLYRCNASATKPDALPRPCFAGRLSLLRCNNVGSYTRAY